MFGTISKKKPAPPKAQKPCHTAVRRAHVSDAREAPNGGLEWTLGCSSPSDITPAEFSALRRAFGGGSPNMEVAAAVKDGILKGQTIVQIAFHHRGKQGFSERNIKRYHTPLLRAVGEGFKK